MKNAETVSIARQLSSLGRVEQASLPGACRGTGPNESMPDLRQGVRFQENVER